MEYQNPSAFRSILHYCSVELSMLSDPARMRGSRSVSKRENGGRSGDKDGDVDTSW